jgi:hypothetical protein
MSSQRQLFSAFVLIVAALSTASVVAQAATGRILNDAPMFLLPDAKRQPLLVMEAGVLVEIHRREGTWFNVTVDGSQSGRRTGYVEAHLIEVVKADETIPRVTASSAIPPRTQTPTPQPVSPAQPSLPANSASAAPVALPPTRAAETFQKSKLNITVDDDTRESDVIVRYDPNALLIVDKKSGAAAKTFPYAEMKGAEYSYAKSPRWKTAIFVSPLFLFTSGKKHWFLVQGTGDYALLHLDKSNYRLILAAFEARTGLKVETVADSK